jgi:hypothetical protein
MAGRDDPQQFGEWIADVERPENHDVRDGTSNTLMIGEVTQFLDDDLSVVKLLDANNPSVGKPVVQTGVGVAMETVAIVHEGFELM